jgi:hypothetical protein
MTVKELIEKLKKIKDKDKMVTYYHLEYGMEEVTDIDEYSTEDVVELY